jgi:hypothetical protein
MKSAGTGTSEKGTIHSMYIEVYWFAHCVHTFHTENIFIIKEN